MSSRRARPVWRSATGGIVVVIFHSIEQNETIPGTRTPARHIGTYGDYRTNAVASGWSRTLTKHGFYHIKKRSRDDLISLLLFDIGFCR